MANQYGVQYTKEWINNPSEKANKATRNAAVKCYYDEATGVATGDIVFICKLQTKGIFLGLESIVGALGAGAVVAIDKAGNSTTISKGDVVDGKVDGGLAICLTADAATATSLKLMAKFLLD